MSDFIYLCPECGSCFSSETSLQEHELAVHSSRNHVCILCHNVLNGLELLQRHMAAHQNSSHCCNICGMLCENKVDVYVHVTTSHKYGGRMVCDLCLKTFSSSSSLKVHSIKAHAAKMPDVLQKWELFCNIHSQRNLNESDAVKDSFYPSVECPLHPKDKQSGDKINNTCLSNAQPMPNLLSETTMNDAESQSTLTELQIFLQEQSGKETWYTKSTDHLKSSIQPNDILESSQPSIERKNRLQEDQPIECRFCYMTFSNMSEYLLAHDGKDPSNVCPHKEEEKPASQSRLQDLVEFCKSTVGNTSQVPFKNCDKKLSSNATAVIQEDEDTCAKNQNDQLEPNSTLLAEMSWTIQNVRKYFSVVSQNDQLEPNGTSLAERSALHSQTQNKKASGDNYNFQLKQNGSLLAEMPTLTLQIQNKNSADENQGELHPNGTLLAEISALTIRNQNGNASSQNQNDQSEPNCMNLAETSGTDDTK